MNAGMTVQEWEQEIERCAVARFICKTGRIPTRAECAAELRMMEQEGVRPRALESECAQWLRERGVAIPGRDVNAARQMPSKPTASAALATATATPTVRPVALAAVERGAPVFVVGKAVESTPIPAAVAKVKPPKFKPNFQATVVQQLVAAHEQVEKLEAALS